MTSSKKAGKSKAKATSKTVEKVQSLPTKTLIHIKYPIIKYDEDVDDKNSQFIKVQLNMLQTLARVCQKYDNGNGCDLPIIIGSLYDALNETNKQALLADTISTGFKSDYDSIAKLRPNKLTELQFQILTVFKPVEILWYLDKLHYGIPGVEKKETEEIDKKYREEVANVTIGSLGQLDSGEFENLNEQNVGLANMTLIKRERQRNKIIKNTINTHLTSRDTIIVITNNMLNLSNFIVDNYLINVEIINVI